MPSKANIKEKSFLENKYLYNVGVTRFAPKMNKKIIISFFAIIAVIIIMSPDEPTREPPLYNIYISHIRFDNITHMYDTSELVIHGVIDSSFVEAKFRSNVKTRFTLNIVEVLKGTHTSDTIIVTQDGGVFEGETIRVKDEPLMKVGDEMVLYLAYNPSAESYVVIGGPQGRYLIQNGKLYHLTELDDSIQFVTPALHVKGADANNLRQKLTP